MAKTEKSIYGDFVHCVDETHKNVEVFAEHVFMF